MHLFYESLKRKTRNMPLCLSRKTRNMPLCLSSSSYLKLCFFLCLHFCIALASNNETDKLALLEFRAKIRGDPLGVLSSWNDSLHFCEWHGVICGSRHHRVRVLDLHSFNLTGSISPHIGNLSFLRTLLLHNNSFTGTIPPQIGQLRRLQILMLTNNSIVGQIPSNISACSKLTDLRLQHNQLVGGIPFELGFLFNLRFLDFGINNLTGSIPSSLGNLSFLGQFSICENNMGGRIPHGLGRIRTLNFLSLCGNHLSGIFPHSIFNLSFLTVLNLGENNLRGRLPSGLGNTLPKLQILSLFENQFSGPIPASISNSSNLQYLELYENYFQGQVPSLHNLHNLITLELSGNLGTGKATDLEFLTSLVNASSLYLLSVEHSNLTGPFPPNICNFSSLNVLSIEFNKFYGPVPTCIENLANLQSIYASYNSLSGFIPPSIGKLQNLHFLSLEENQLSGPIPFSIGNLTQLIFLSLTDNKLEGHVPSSLGNCKNIQKLHLSQNNFSGEIPAQVLIGLSTSSITIDLSYNQLTGSLPTEVGELIHLDGLYVYKNKFLGEIPSTLSACTSLEYLYMGANFFNGSIPLTLANLKGLLELDLSDNNLSGSIPKFLASLQLKMLNLSYNQLEGHIPEGGIFSNATGVSLFGNSKLCGGIPKLKLPPCNFSKRKTHHKMQLVIAILCGISGAILLVAFASLYVICYRKKSLEVTSDSKDSLLFLSYQNLHNATNGFSSENLIGNGAYGAVYKGTLDQHGTMVAIKKFHLKHKGASKSFLVECGALQNIRHRNLVRVVTTCSGVDYQGNDFKALIYEYMVNGSLEDWLHVVPLSSLEETSDAPRRLNLLQRLGIAIDIAFALDYLHHHSGVPIVHCDLKPSNVLLDDDMVAHVGDFGLAKFLSESIPISNACQSSSLGVRGTVGYTPPEYGLGNEVSTEGDVYSFGILLLEMFTGKKPTDDIFKEGFNLHSFVNAALPEQVIEIVDQSLLVDITTDQEADAAAEHNFSKIGNNNIVILEALISILGIALVCSVELPQERMDMSEVAVKLSLIRNKILGSSPKLRRNMAGMHG